MPLVKGKSEKAFKKNVETEMKHGKPQKQALAIAFNTQRASRKKKKASGGVVESGSKDMNMSQGGMYAKGGIIGGQAPGETEQRHGPAKPGYGHLSAGPGNAEQAKSPRPPSITADEQAKARQMLEHEHTEECFAHGGMCKYGFGGVVGAYAPGCEEGGDAHIARPGYGSLGAGSDQAPRRPVSPREGSEERQAKTFLEDSAGYEGIADRIRKRRMMAEGGVVGKNNDGDYDFDIQDEIEHPNYFYSRNEDVTPGERMYHDDYGPDPMDSNEKGDDLKDEDEHGKSMFKRIKLKKAQKGDRGNY